MRDIVERLRKAANDPHTVSTTVRNGVRHWEIGCDKELLLEAADEIERLREILHTTELFEVERKKHTANENKCGNCYFFIPNVGLINRNEHTKDGTCGRHAYEKVFCGKEDYCSWWLAIPPKGEEE